MTELSLLLWFIQFCIGFTVLVIVGVPMLTVFDYAKECWRDRK